MADSPYHAAIAFLTKPLRFRFLNETAYSFGCDRQSACVVWGGGEVLQDGGIQDDGLGVQGAVLRSDGVRVARKAGRRVAFVPTDSIATAAAAVRS